MFGVKILSLDQYIEKVEEMIDYGLLPIGIEYMFWILKVTL